MRNIPIEGPVVDKLVTGLSRSPMFATVNPESLVQIASRGELVQFDPGETIVREGEPSDSFFFVMNGEVRVLIEAKNEQVEVGLFKPPECFGEMGLLLDKPRTATIVAKTSSHLLRFSSQIFTYFMQKLPDFGLSIARFLAVRLNNMSQLSSKDDDNSDLPPREVLDLLPLEFCERQGVMAIESAGQRVVLGFMRDPTPQVVQMAKNLLRGMEIQPVRIDAGFFDRCVKARAAPSEWSGSAKPEDDDETKRSSPKLDVMLKRMVAEGASDLHLSGRQEPRWRIDGEIRAIPGTRPLASTEVFELLEPIMREATREEFKSTNDVDFAYAIESVARFRVNLFRDKGGVSAVFRQIPDRVLTIEQLGLPPVIQSMCDFPKGLIVVTGPTGSGKSTTLAAMIDYINKNKRSHIITLEDPVEFVHKSQACLINQREIGSHTKSFHRALKAALREDPDIVLVGEMRDLETVSLALETANTGHLVFGTLHTSTAISTIDRIIDLFPPEQQGQVRSALSDCLRCVVAQTLCRRAGGGRVAALEILVSNAAVANLIREAKNSQIMSIMTTQKALGNRLLTEELAALVHHRVVAYEEAMAKAVDKATLAKLLGQAPPKL